MNRLKQRSHATICNPAYYLIKSHRVAPTIALPPDPPSAQLSHLPVPLPFHISLTGKYPTYLAFPLRIPDSQTAMSPSSARRFGIYSSCFARTNIVEPPQCLSGGVIPLPEYLLRKEYASRSYPSSIFFTYEAALGKQFVRSTISDSSIPAFPHHVPLYGSLFASLQAWVGSPPEALLHVCNSIQLPLRRFRPCLSYCARENREYHTYYKRQKLQSSAH